MENYIYLIINSGGSGHRQSPGTIALCKAIKNSASPKNSAGYFSIVRRSRPGLLSGL